MQFVNISRNTTLNQLRDKVGSSNLENVLVVNELKRVPNIGEQLYAKQNEAATSVDTRRRSSSRNESDTGFDFKIASLNNASQDSDVFENLALMGETGWRVYRSTLALPGTLRLPEGLRIAASENVIGNAERVDSVTYTKVMKSLYEAPHTVDPSIFSKYSSEKSNTQVSIASAFASDDMFHFFKIPWGNMSIYSSISKSMKDFPVYPEDMADGVKANYTQMPELIYQYEPWQLYQSSGPRSNSYTFTFHRDMWTGDHRDGKANELIRFCMANCYPEYNGSSVNTSTVTLFMNGKNLITGVLNDVNVNWDGPLGAYDNFYLVCKLTLSITEVSPYPLDYWTMMRKPLIGY